MNENKKTVDINDLTFDEFRKLWWQAKIKWGITGTFFSREDAEGVVEGLSEAPLTDELWMYISNSSTWTDDLEERLCVYGWEFVYDAVEEAIKDMKEENQ